jgi:hypothetical protein
MKTARFVNNQPIRQNQNRRLLHKTLDLGSNLVENPADFII